MKRITALITTLAFLLLAGCAAQMTATNPPAKPPASGDWTISVSWQQDFTNFKPCSATATAGCISGYTWGYLQGGTQVPIKTSPASVCSGSTQPETCSDSANSTLGIGAVTFFCVADYIDNGGNALSVAPITTAQPDNVVLNGFSGLTETRQ